jgi:hypothetical protein
MTPASVSQPSKVYTSACNFASPFEPLFAAAHGSLPAAFRDQFLLAADDRVGVTLTGSLDRVWHRPLWLGPLFRLLGRWEILVPDNGINVPTTLTVRSVLTDDGTPRQTWLRTMRFARLRRFPTWVVPRTDGRVEEIVGPRDLAHMVWRGRFDPPATLTLDGVACGVRIAGRVWWLPGWLWPWLVGVMHLEQRAESMDGQRVHVRTTLRHPLLGDVFGYEGSFDVVRNT